MKSIREIPLHGRTVFLRVDFNVPLDKNGNITEDTRIKAALPTIEYILQKGGKIVLASHLGRPKNQVKPELRLGGPAKRLQELLGQKIYYVPDCIGEVVEKTKAGLKNGEIMLLDNLRFYKAEKENDLHFAEQLAQNIDVYINDAFGVIHRQHASVNALPSLIFDKGIGFLMEKEMEALDKIIKNPAKPLVVVIGGVKISDKVEIINNLAPMADIILVGGGVANTFLKGLGQEVGASIVESDSVSKKQEKTNYLEVAAGIFKRFQTERVELDVILPNQEPLHKIQLPLDFVAATDTKEGTATKIIELGKDRVAPDLMFLDIGPKTIKLYQEVLTRTQTIFWNGPIGLFEMPVYAQGSKSVAESIAETAGYTVLGGGDTEVVVDKFDLKGRFSNVSTGGGASLAYLAQKELPGLSALE